MKVGGELYYLHTEMDGREKIRNNNICQGGMDEQKNRVKNLE